MGPNLLFGGDEASVHDEFPGHVYDLEQLWVIATAFVLSVFMYCVFRELRVPGAPQSNRENAYSYLTNLSTFLFNDTVLSLLSVSSLFFIADRYAGFGPVSRLQNPWLEWPLSLILMDLAMYFWHMANHHCGLLWRFHRVHHSDLVVNVSTGVRFHIGEVFLTTVYKALFIVLLGVHVHWVLINQALITCFVFFHHSNTRFTWEDKVATYLIVPALHRVHHSAEPAEQRCNYGEVFSLWDHWFGTFRRASPRRIGLDDVPRLGFIGLFRLGLPASRSMDEAVRAVRARIGSGI